VSALVLLRAILARVVVIREAIADGDAAYASSLAADLEYDLTETVMRLERAA
jgi:hypothetical protein